MYFRWVTRGSYKYELSCRCKQICCGEKYQENTPTRLHLGALLNSMRCTCAHTHTHFPAVGHVLVHTSLELASARTHTHHPIGAVASDVDLKGALSVESYWGGILKFYSTHTFNILGWTFNCSEWEIIVTNELYVLKPNKRLVNVSKTLLNINILT